MPLILSIFRLTGIVHVKSGRLRAHGLKVLVPQDEHHAEMYRIICDELSHTPIMTTSRGWMVEQICSLAARGAMGVVLGCTVEQF